MYNRKLKYLIVLMFLLLGTILPAQKEIVLKYKRNDSSHLLRWATSDIALFKEAVKNGYTLKKIECSNEQDIVNMDWSKAESILIFPSKQNDSIWNKYFLIDERIVLINELLFSTEKMSEMIEANIYGLALAACDQNPILAKLAGLYYEDSLISSDKSYAYRLETNGKKKLNTVIFIDKNHRENLPSINEFNLSKSKKAVNIEWKHAGQMIYFSSFQIERSLDSLHFEALLDQKFVPMQSQYEKEKLLSHWTDTAIKLHQKYYYKITAYDFFGEKVKESAIKSIIVYPTIETAIQIDSIGEIKPNQLQLSWSHEPDENIVAYNIYHSESINGNYQLVGKTTEQKYSLPVSKYANYLKVTAISNYEDSISSWPELFLLPDRIAPEPVQNLKGKMDSVGNVFLKWNNSREDDFLGYRVFRSNEKTEEFIEVTKEFSVQNEFHDSIFLENLTEEIFYLVVAVDNNYNNSKITDTLKLKKPDNIAPIFAPIVNAESTLEGIKIHWINSTSEDVFKTELLFSYDNKYYEKRAEFTVQDTTQFYLDSTIYKKEVYYKTRVTDDDGNSTESKSVYVFNHHLKDKKKYSCKALVDRTKREITLSWTTPDEKIFSYSIYKAKKGEVMRNFKTLEQGVLSYVDKELYISNTYIYSIKAVLESGREVVIVDALEVEY